VLRFTDTSGGNSISDLYLDGVSVTAAVPEPAAVAWVAGLVAAGAVGWRRRCS
jgi:MYXO-CTERM domain-containing protein